MARRPPTDFDRQVGANIQAARQAQGIRQYQLAGAVGLLREQLCRAELGGAAITLPRLLLIATALGMCATALLPPAATAAK